MKQILISGIAGILFMSLTAQTSDSTSYKNSAERLLETNSKLSIGGYGQIDFNQPFAADEYNIGTLDVHRLVLLFGYKFSKNTRFITEIEYEHVKELYVEQAFINHKINEYVNFRGGLLLIPMGITNEYHEPTTFNGVERPVIDKTISPTTWREIGFGFSGNINPATLKYQLYIVNGFLGYDGAGKLSGSKGYRSGRQKGAESIISSPNVTGKLSYYGVSGFDVGISFYSGKTQSAAYNGIDKNDNSAIKSADSSVVGITMFGLDTRYSNAGFQFKGQIYYALNSNVEEYNTSTGQDLGTGMYGFYVETAYDVLRLVSNLKYNLVPFVRYEKLDTHYAVPNGTLRNSSYNSDIVTVGVGLKLANGAVLKSDIQLIKPRSSDSFSKTFNAGIGIWF